MAERSVTLSREEARLVSELLEQEVDDPAKGLNEPDKRMLLRVALKLRAAEPDHWYGGGLLGETPDWVQEILAKTFAPPPGPAKKPVPKTARPAARKAGAAPAARKRVLPKGAGQGLRAGAAAGGALDAGALGAAHQAIDRSHRSTAEKAEAHKALDAGAAAGGAR